MAGLTAAFRLQQRGADVVLFEAERHVGGRAFTDDLDGFRVDTSAQLAGSMYQHFLELTREVGLADRLVRVPGRDALWRDGKAHEVVLGSVTSMVTSGGLPFSTKMRLGAVYVPFLNRHLQDLELVEPERAAAAGLDKETIASWGDREIDRAFVRSLVYPQLGAYYGCLPSETSAGFYHILARQGMDVKLFALARGMGEVPDVLMQRIVAGGGEVRRENRVERIEVLGKGNGARVMAGEGVEEFDGVVAAIPASTLVSVLDGASRAMGEWLSAVRYRPTLSVALLLDRPTPVRYFGLSFPEGDSRHVAALCVEENKHAGLVPEGKGLIVLLPTPETAPALVGLESREIVDRMVPEITRALPGIDRRIIRARVYRWPVGVPVFFPGYLTHLSAFRSGNLEGDAPFVIAGDYLHTPSVEGSVVSGERAADRLVRRLTT